MKPSQNNTIGDKAGIFGIYFLMVVAVALSVYAITLCKENYIDKTTVQTVNH